MSILDVGPTSIDDSGRIQLSPQARRIPPTGDVNNQNVMNIPPLAQDPTQAPPMFSHPVGALPQNIQNISPVPTQAQSQAPQMSPGTPKYSIPSDKYKNIEESAPQRDDPRFKQHGLAKLGNIIASVPFGPFAPLVHNALNQIPFERAQGDWQQRLAAIKPELEQENVQTRERGETERHGQTIEETKQLRNIEEQNAQERQRHDIAQEQENQRKIEQKAIQDAELNKIRREINARLSGKPPAMQERAYQLYAKQARGEELSPVEASELQGYKAIQKDKSNLAVAGAEARGRAYGAYRPVQISDPTVPGEVRYEFAGDAIKDKSQTTASIPFQVLRGQALASLPTATVRTMAQRSQTILPQMEEVSKEVDNLENEVGPLAGRWEKLWVNKGGFDDPAFAKLDANLELLSSAITLAHGLHQEYQKQLKQHFQEAQSPEDLKARIAAADSWILGYANMIPKNPVQKPGGSSSSIVAPSSKVKIIKREDAK